MKIQNPKHNINTTWGYLLELSDFHYKLNILYEIFDTLNCVERCHRQQSVSLIFLSWIDSLCEIFAPLSFERRHHQYHPTVSLIHHYELLILYKLSWHLFAANDIIETPSIKSTFFSYLTEIPAKHLTTTDDIINTPKVFFF